MKAKLSALSRWAVVNGGMAYLTWLGVNDNEGAARVVTFLVCSVGLLMFALCGVKEVQKAVQKKGRPIPAWLSHTTGFAFLFVFVYYGWIVTAIFCLLNEISEAVLFSKPAKGGEGAQ